MDDQNKQADSAEAGTEGYFFRASAADFRKIPGSPVAYWVSDAVNNAFRDFPPFDEVAPTRKGMVTARNEIYVRDWYEVSLDKAGLDMFKDRRSAQESGKKWFSYLKGGGYRKWYGNKFDVVNWENDGLLLQTKKHPSEDRVWATNFNLEFVFNENINWGAVSSSDFSARISEGGELFDAGGSACFPVKASPKTVLGFLNAKVSRVMLRALNPTLNFQAGNIANLPFLVSVDTDKTRSLVDGLISAFKVDWNSYETSWGFTTLPLLQSDYQQMTLQSTYQKVRDFWRDTTLEMQRFEEENNQIFIEAYCLQDELTPEVPLKDITLTCNPYNRYGGDKTDEELDALLQADTMREFLSYAVGCMFGRYSLDKPGLLLANQGETLVDYLREVPAPRFMPDEDSVIPLLDGEWFSDDVSERFRQFLRVTFGEQHYEENLAFIEAALGKDIRKYFLKEFYVDHVKRYKKRPIYWLFASPKGTFNALIYVHRYRADTVSVVLQYLRDFRKKLAARQGYLQQVSISPSASQGDKTRALKEVEMLNKQLLELDDYERDTLYPLATEQVALDLDDGVKVNYLKLGPALKKISGLEAKDD